MKRAAQFYQQIYKETEYSNSQSVDVHPWAATLKGFLQEYSLESGKCLEVGSGRGAFQNVVQDYTGVDLSETVAPYYHKPFVAASCEALPFADDTFDAVWSYAVLEHVDNPETALREIRRVLKPDGLLLLEPAWQCRSWAANGYQVRPYSDFGPIGKLIKASIPLRDSVAFRSAYVFPRRLLHLCLFLLGALPAPFRYRRLKANFDVFWVSDSDAQNSMDPFDCILWFRGQGDECLNYPSLPRAFMVRTGPLVVRIRKQEVR